MAGMFTTKGRYALRVMADLAQHEGWVSSGDVAERQHLSRKYLEQVIYIPSATAEDKAIDDTVIIGDPYLKFIWKYDIITYVAIKDWVNDYFAGPGIDISAGHEVSVKLAEVDDDNQNYLTVDDNGLKMNMFIEIDE